MNKREVENERKTDRKQNDGERVMYYRGNGKKKERTRKRAKEEMKQRSQKKKKERVKKGKQENEGMRDGLLGLRASSCAPYSLRIVGNAACTMFRSRCF